MKRLLVLFLAGMLLAPLAVAQDPGAPEDRPRVRLETNRGTIVLALRPDKAPKTVANFLEYVRADHYDGTIFHRVIPGFMIQGGGFTPDFEEKPTREPIPNEADNGLHNGVGTVAMARTGRPHSATAQFFINVADNGALDFRSKTRRGWGYAVFGKVVDGMETVKAIAATPTGAAGPFPKDVPQKPVVIEKAQVVADEEEAG